MTWFKVSLIFSHNKIQMIRDKLSSIHPSPDIPPFEETCAYIMEKFDPLTEEEVGKLIQKSSNDFCELDPLPTWLFKDCQEVLITPVKNIVNLSFSTGV